MVLWQVVRACVADYKLTGTPFPCLEVDLSGGEERGTVVLRPPLLEDTVLAPTRLITGIEDPFLRSPEAPNYFDAAWRARTFLKDEDGQAPEDGVRHAGVVRLEEVDGSRGGMAAAAAVASGAQYRRSRPAIQ